ncbi:hypothetical protein FB567DRAFT_192687 [Paraphoma chrysanthemicola]|uniref:F-box domain-containing protein n=1 Tax=Paraphoma chrysanthemicola TaxID=798071 RepID=A0A8K0QWB9_9PLEO|nr:hypothetical protein FB567DRAFT_192687 [Paraphoma chrysanthemicola]
MDPSKPFPFTSLPLELRLMIYERIPIEIKQHAFTRPTKLQTATPNDSTSSPCYSFTILAPTISPTILLTNRQLYIEALPIIQHKRRLISLTPPKLVLDLPSAASHIQKPGGVLWHISHLLARRAVKARKSLGHVPYLGIGTGGSSGRRYDAASDPDHARLEKLIVGWMHSLDAQRQHIKSTGQTTDQFPCIEVALTAPLETPVSITLHTLRQLAYVLFAEHGQFRWVLRSVEGEYPSFSEEMVRQEEEVVGKVMAGWRRGRPGEEDIVQAIRGAEIEREEWEERWVEGEC